MILLAILNVSLIMNEPTGCANSLPVLTNQSLETEGTIMAISQATLADVCRQFGIKQMCPIADDPRYYVTTDGRVVSFVSAPRILKFGWSGSYPSVCIASQRRVVHRLVLEAFVGPCPTGMECCHNDGNPANNHLSNLRWDTRRNNHADKKQHGTWQGGENNGFSVLTLADVVAIKTERLNGASFTDIARQHNVSRSTVSLIVKGKRWQHVAVYGPRMQATKRGKLTWNGRTLSARQWAKESGVTCHTISRRLREGWSVGDAISKPSQLGVSSV